MRDGHMVQCEPCIQIKKKKKGKSKKEKGETDSEHGEERRDKKEKKKIFFSLLFKIYENIIVGFCWSKRKSRSTH